MGGRFCLVDRFGDLYRVNEELRRAIAWRRTTLTRAGGWGWSATRQKVEESKRERGQDMNTRTKRHTIIRDTHTGEILAVCDLSEARARAIVKAYLKAGLFVEAVA
jgi:hypothetical protein